MIKLIWISVLLVVTGCGPITSLHDDVVGKNYVIGRTRDASAGSVMIRIIGKAYSYAAFTPRFVQEFPGGKLAPGQRWIAYNGFRNDKSKYILTCEEVDNNDTAIIVNKDGEITDDKPVMQNIKKIFVVSAFREQYKRASFDNLKDNKLFERVDNIIQADGDFSAELIYSGVMNNVIVINYREFIKDFSRPSFYQEVKYDLNTTNEIVFKSIKMKILEANNSNIKFQVLDDGDLPWVTRN